MENNLILIFAVIGVISSVLSIAFVSWMVYRAVSEIDWKNEFRKNKSVD